MDSNNENWVTKAGGWDGIIILGVAFVMVFIGAWIVANGHAV